MASPHKSAKRLTSYEVYIRNRNTWASKGYAMTEAMSEDEYNQFHKLARAAGLPNVARDLAHDNIIVKHNEAREIKKRIDKMEKKLYNIDPETGKKEKKSVEEIKYDNAGSREKFDLFDEEKGVFTESKFTKEIFENKSDFISKSTKSRKTLFDNLAEAFGYARAEWIFYHENMGQRIRKHREKKEKI